MDPEKHDSSVFLFHNNKYSFPTESRTVNIGKFQSGKPIVLMFKFCDTIILKPFLGKRLYTGQNRDSIDDYISDLTSIYSDRQLAIAGRIDSNTVEVGFDDAMNATYANAILYVKNVYLECLEKSKVPRPIIDPRGGPFQSTLNVSLSLKNEGLLSIIKRYSGSDTIDPINQGAILKFLYTQDNSDPRSSPTSQTYTAPIVINQTDTLKTYAFLETDTNWFASEVITEVYTKDASTIRDNIKLNQFANNVSDFKIYSIKGQLIRTITTKATNIGEYTSFLSPGIYFLQSNNTTVIKRIIVGR